MRRVADLHLAFLGEPVAGFSPLADHLALFAPARMRPHVDDANPLAAATLRGWELFGEQVPHDVADAVARLLDDPRPLAGALLRRPSTLLHGDLATVNMAFEGDRLILIDWAMAGRGPGAVDVARFVAGCSQVLDASREEILAEYAACHGSVPRRDRDASRTARRPASGSGGTRRSTQRCTTIRRSVSASVTTSPGGCLRPGPPSARTSSDRDGPSACSSARRSLTIFSMTSSGTGRSAENRTVPFDSA